MFACGTKCVRKKVFKAFRNLGKSAGVDDVDRAISLTLYYLTEKSPINHLVLVFIYKSSSF